MCEALAIAMKNFKKKTPKKTFHISADGITVKTLSMLWFLVL